MKALVLGVEGRLDLVDRERPRCERPDDVVVAIRQTGICGTDRGVVVGKFSAEPGVILGHEAVGEVAEIGSGVSTLRPGDRVIINPTLWCGLCRECRQGRLGRCLNKAGTEVGIDRDGAFAEYICLAERFLYLIPPGMSDDRAVGVEPLACVLNNLDAAGLSPGDTVTILGGGPIGLVCALTAAHLGAVVRLVEADERRRELAKAMVLHGRDAAAVTVFQPAAAKDQLISRIVIDTVGGLLEQACDLVATDGTVVVMGFNNKASATVRPLQVLQRSIRIIGAGDYNSLIFPRAIELAGVLPLDRLVTHHFTLDQHQEAFRAVAADESTSGYSAIKVVIEGRTGDAA